MPCVGRSWKSIKEPSWLERVIEYFSRATDELVGECVLPQVELATLQRVWGAPPIEPMVECFAIEEGQAPFFRQLVGIAFDFSRYGYFLAAYATDLYQKPTTDIEVSQQADIQRRYVQNEIER